MQTSVPEIAAYSGAVITLMSWLVKKLIDHYFDQQSKMKNLESQILQMTQDFTLKAVQGV